MPVPHPAPSVAGGTGYGQGEPYIFGSDQGKFPPAHVLMTPTSTTFTYLQQDQLQQQQQEASSSTSTLPIEVTQPHWHAPSNSLIFSQGNVPSSQDVSLVQNSQTQVTFTHPPSGTQANDTFQNANIFQANSCLNISLMYLE